MLFRSGADPVDTVPSPKLGQHNREIYGDWLGLSADEIPLLSRILAVADAYNAMTSDRPYRDAMPSQVARLRLAQAVETQFDTTVVAAFEAILATNDENYRTAKGGDFGWPEDEQVSREPERKVPALVAVT